MVRARGQEGEGPRVRVEVRVGARVRVRLRVRIQLGTLVNHQLSSPPRSSLTDLSWKSSLYCFDTKVSLGCGRCRESQHLDQHE